MSLISQIQVKYGVPQPDIHLDPGGSFQPLYGSMTYGSGITSLVSTILSPFVIFLSFFVGFFLYLFTHKKVFIIIPLVMIALSIVFSLIRTVFGI